MKIRFTKRKNSDSKIQDSKIAEEKPEVKDSIAAGDKPKTKAAKFFNILRKLQGGKTAGGKPEVQESIAAEEKPKIRAAKFFIILRKLQGGKTAGEKPEVKDSIIPEESPEVKDSMVTEGIPEIKKAKFLWLFRKPKGGKAAEEMPEAPESEAAEIIPEVQESITPEEAPEVQESMVTEGIPEIKKAKFLRFLRKPKGGKAAEGMLETPESEAAEIIPEAEAGQKLPEEAEKVLFIKKKPWTLTKKIIVSIASVLILAAFTAGLYFVKLSFVPLSGWNFISEQTHEPVTSVSPQTSGDNEPVGPSPTIDPYEVLRSQADFSMLDDIVNILLIGVDHGDERDLKDWTSHGGKTAWHSDVMIILSINTNTNKVSLISLPRDTFAKIPGVNGIYKLNASLNCGGGWPTAANNYSRSGFEKVCEAASWMIGGIPVEYYYAVDFSAVKELVDAVGGVDFNVDIAFEINGRPYKKGWQHMTGQGALDYMRVRKPQNIEDPKGETGDLNRINRQKAMLVAIFETLKRTGGISTLPDILRSFDGNLYTNIPIDQTAGLAYYAYENIDSETIDVYSMGGKSDNIFYLTFVVTDVKNRVDIVKKVYGIDISKDKQFSEVYSMYKRWSYDRARSLWYNMQTEVALGKSRCLLDEAKNILDADALLPPRPSSSALYFDPSEGPSPTEPGPSDTPAPSEPGPSDTPAPSEPGPSDTPAPTEYRKYGDDIRQLYETCEEEYTELEGCSEDDCSDKRKDLIEKYKTDVQDLCTALSIKAKKWDQRHKKWIGEKWEDFWTVIYNSGNKNDCNQDYIKNQIYVDFR